MGSGYTVRCSDCAYQRDLLIGQGDDAFYEFYEETLFVCHACQQLTVVTVPLPYDMLVYLCESGFDMPWSRIAEGQSTPSQRQRECTRLIERYREGAYEEMQCNSCGSTDIEVCEEVPVTCPKCDTPTLEVVASFDWA